MSAWVWWLVAAVVLGIVEGLTEFLPVSSTGHLIVAGSLLNYTGDRAKVFEIVIQAGAILAVCWEFRAKLVRVLRGLWSDRTAQRFALNLAIAFLPAAILGLLFSKLIKSVLFAPVPVALAFIVGAFIILWAERRQKSRPGDVRIDDVDAMRWTDALKVGCAQALALIPGFSRSGATMGGGLLMGLSNKDAARFAFLLATPIIGAAAILKLPELAGSHGNGVRGQALVGALCSALTAYLAVRFLMRYFETKTLIPFAIYCVLAGLGASIYFWVS